MCLVNMHDVNVLFYHRNGYNIYSYYVTVTTTSLRSQGKEIKVDVVVIHMACQQNLLNTALGLWAMESRLNHQQAEYANNAASLL